MKITEHRRNERRLKEKKVLENMDKDPKIFYDYIKEQNKRDNAVGPFKKNKKYIYDAREICQALADQYNSGSCPSITGLNSELYWSASA